MKTKDIAETLKKRLGIKSPKIALILGSGLGDLINIVQIKIIIIFFVEVSNHHHIIISSEIVHSNIIAI